MEARRDGNRSIWFGLGMFGIVGWSVAVPTLVGAAIGVWIDSRYPSRFSWTLMLLFAGVLFGSINAWYWINRVGKNG
ncbi:MAG: AtpZ/AtpI family protein [Deltaproteobacteria bacterium]|nr:AtpZ/AtpI family protein [Deltaproteobacteria bacterium]